MDNEQLKGLIDSTDINNRDQVRTLQKVLKGKGYYTGPIDGVFGGKTTESVREFTTDYNNGLNVQRDLAVNDPTNRLTKFATEFGPWAIGGVAGVGVDELAKWGLKKSAKKDVANVSRLARQKGLNPQVVQGELNNINRLRGLRLASRLGIPLSFMGAATGTRELLIPYASENMRDFLTQSASAEQMGALASAAWMMKSPFPGDKPDPVDVAKIRSKALDAKTPAADDLDARAKTLQNSMTREQIKDQLKKAGQPTSGLKPDLARRLASISATAGKVVKAFPPVAGGLAAYDMATSQAQAAGLGETGSTAAGAGAAVAGAGAGYGLQKGAEYLGSKIAGTAAGKVAARAIPGVGAAVLGYDAYSAAYDAARDPESMERRAEYDRIFRQPGGVSAEASRMATPDLGGESGPGPETEPGDADVARAFQQSPRQTVIELVRQGLDADDIAMLAGVSAEDVESVVGAIPPQAMRPPQRAVPAAGVPAF